MKRRRDSAVVMFADLSFLVVTVLISGYFFVSIKKETEVQEQASDKGLMESEIEFVKLVDGKPGSKSITADNRDILKVVIPEEGGKYIIGNKEVRRFELERELSSAKFDTVRVGVDKRAPSQDTLYLFSVFEKLKLKMELLHYLEDKQ